MSLLVRWTPRTAYKSTSTSPTIVLASQSFALSSSLSLARSSRRPPCSLCVGAVSSREKGERYVKISFCENASFCEKRSRGWVGGLPVCEFDGIDDGGRRAFPSPSRRPPPDQTGLPSLFSPQSHPPAPRITFGSKTRGMGGLLTLHPS